MIDFLNTGEIASVENTPFDFRKRTPIGERINESFDGYDIMFVIEGEGKRPFGKFVFFGDSRKSVSFRFSIY